MRKIIALMAVAILMSSVASYAETEPINLSNMSLEELTSLRDEINILIEAMKEAEDDSMSEIMLEEGLYQIGIDIPAGLWKVIPFPSRYTMIECGRIYNPDSGELESRYYIGLVVSESHPNFSKVHDAITYDEIELEAGTYIHISKDAAILQIIDSSKQKTVTVPQGVYEIGVDIPEGHWDIAAAPGQFSQVFWGKELDEGKKNIKYSTYLYQGSLVSETSISYDPGDTTSVDLELVESTYLIVKHGEVVFTPYSGKPSLGF